MGCCYSYIEKQKQQKLKLLETINNTIDNLSLLQKEEYRKQQLLREERNELEQAVIKEKENLTATKEKHTQTIETIKMFECKICMEKLNRVMLIPCGHCFCLECAKNIINCPICRSNVKGINKIYFN